MRGCCVGNEEGTMDKKVDEAVDAVESMCAPGFMTRQDAVDFLEDVIARLEADVDALREQIEKDQQ
jgi:hypothetical protein